MGNSEEKRTFVQKAYKMCVVKQTWYSKVIKIQRDLKLRRKLGNGRKLQRAGNNF